MEWRRFAGVLAVATALGAGMIASTALADGLPVVGVDVGDTGVGTTDGAYRYVTLPAAGSTVVARVEQDGGRVAARRTVPGRFTIPAVAYDGSADGLSADGTTLVLITPRSTFPRAQTTLAVVDATRLRLRTTLHLKGDFSFDAISPDGATLYLVQYVSATDPTDYRVRAYDLAAGRLVPAPIVDPTEPGERMGGLPVTRAWSPDRRWAYTLYRRTSGHPFVHALDTRGRTARCIDLDAVAGDISAARLDVSPDGRTVTLVRNAGTVATIDTATFAVTLPQLAGGAATVVADDGRAPAWLVAAVGGGAAVLFAAGVTLARRRRTSHAGARGDLRHAHGAQAAKDLHLAPGEDPAP